MEVWFESDGAKLMAVDSGQGEPILMLHGGLASHLAVLPLVHPLRARFRVITPDLRGSGQSVDAGPLSWQQLADDVLALMRHLGLQRAVVGGVSSGTGIALRFALRYPEHIAGLVLLTPVYAGEDRGLSPDQVATFRYMDALGSRAPVEGVQALSPLYDALPSPVREQALAMVEGFDAASVAATTRLLASGSQPFASAAMLERLQAPVLVVPGSDALHPHEVSALYARHIVRCEVRDPGDEAQAVADFCARCFAPGAALPGRATPDATPQARMRAGRIHLIVGPVGAGKSTFALRLSRAHDAVCFNLDEWMTTLFQRDRPEEGVMEWYRERVARCIEQIWKLVQRAIEVGTDVVLEIGLIQRRQREDLYQRVDARGFDLTIYALDAPRELRRQRVSRRNREQGETFSMEVPPEIFELASDMWEPLTPSECEGRDARFLSTE